MIAGIPGGYRFILASRSPRRQQLLREAGLAFEVEIFNFDETVPEGIEAAEAAQYLSRKKASEYPPDLLSDNKVIITADTIVWHKGKILDKPLTYEDAFNSLKLISGDTHSVSTGITFRRSELMHTFAETTLVTFSKLSDEEIDYYIRSCTPFDKAGAYGIQEWIGIVANSRIEGSYFNVMGLPVERLIKELRIFLTE